MELTKLDEESHFILIRKCIEAAFALIANKKMTLKCEQSINLNVASTNPIRTSTTLLATWTVN